MARGCTADVYLGRLDPLDVIGDTRVGADGLDDRGGTGADDGGVFHQFFENGGDVAAAAIEKIHGMGVAINRIGIDAILAGDPIHVVPLNECELDGFAIRMRADAAFTRVPSGGSACAGEAGADVVRSLRDFEALKRQRAMDSGLKLGDFGEVFGDDVGGTEDYVVVGGRCGRAEIAGGNALRGCGDCVERFG